MFLIACLFVVGIYIPYALLPLLTLRGEIQLRKQVLEAEKAMYEKQMETFHNTCRRNFIHD